jgi:hypothetical protein
VADAGDDGAGVHVVLGQRGQPLLEQFDVDKGR